MPSPSGPLDNLFRNTHIVALILFGLCCGPLAFVLSLICAVSARDDKARSNALVVMVICLVAGTAGFFARPHLGVGP